jgi:hypothetical protein
MPAATAREVPTFVRRTSLGANEYHTNFRKVDCETISRLTSEEAGQVTSQMCKVYLSLLNAPSEFWEREGVLRFAGEEGGGRWVTAWEQLVALVGVASATARKALRWMHEEGIIGYFAGKNGVGIRVFINRAASSIGTRAAGKKILEFTRASSQGARASTDEAAFSDSYADLEVLETDLNPRAPKSGADTSKVIKNSSHPQQTRTMPTPQDAYVPIGTPRHATLRVEVPIDELVLRLSRELEPSLQAAARRAAAREHERTREWLESRGLPKAARVAQHETYSMLRKHGAINEPSHGRAPRADIGRGDHAKVTPRPLTRDDINDLAGACVALLEAKGQSVELTLSEMSAEGGGFLLPGDAARVRERVASLLDAGDGSGGA